MCPGWVSHECIQRPREKYTLLVPSFDFRRFWIQTNIISNILSLFWRPSLATLVLVVLLRFHVEYVGEISSVFMNANGAPVFLLWQ